MSSEPTSQPGFADLALTKPVLKALDDVGYETPSPIQALTIPHLLAGKDVLGQAQTGTGKTAAFALPLLSRMDIKNTEPQVLVLVPTRELAIQVAEAFQRYASHMKGLHVLPVYGGQDYGVQLRQLKRGVHVVVGTPGRVMDHMRRGTLKLETLSCLVLDEADEMLRMGFIEDVEWILEQTPTERQIALFSATLPTAVRKIAKQHLREPEEVTIKLRTATTESLNQRYWMVSHLHKLDALTRILEAEPFDGMLIFVRTKSGTVELSEKLEARGYASAPLNGDIKQSQRERTVNQFKKGKLDVLVATDVAARGLDVERISHVINYDIPYDTETYIHRVGRTGRAGRSGEAILFASPRERRMLAAIERATRQKIPLMELPSTEVINNLRIAQFKQRITDTIAAEQLEFFSAIVEQYREEHDVPALEIAAALAKLVQGDQPLLLADKPKPSREPRRQSDDRPRKDRGAPQRTRPSSEPGEGMERFRLEVGKKHGVGPGNIVGAIANEAGVDGEYIRGIEIYDEFSTVDLPLGMPNDIYRLLQKVWVAGQQLGISRLSGNEGQDRPKSREGVGGKKHPRKAKASRPKDAKKTGGKPGGKKPTTNATKARARLGKKNKGKPKPKREKR
jgi:ATP-dependent RNA helicase DeaD